jgi:hypothetical protein
MAFNLGMRISSFFVAALLFVGSVPSPISATLTSYPSKEGKVVVILDGDIAPGEIQSIDR